MAYESFEVTDWLLCAALSLAQIVFSMSRLVALRHGEPGQLSQFQQLTIVYGFLYDVSFFGEEFHVI